MCGRVKGMGAVQAAAGDGSVHNEAAVGEGLGAPQSLGGVGGIDSPSIW